MSDEPTIKDLTDENFELYKAEMLEDDLRRKRLNEKWACIGCGLVMGYDYVTGETGVSPFDEKGCRVCGHDKIIPLQEAVTE